MLGWQAEAGRQTGTWMSWAAGLCVPTQSWKRPFSAACCTAATVQPADPGSRSPMLLPSMAQAVFFKMRVAGVLHIFQFETKQGEDICMALQVGPRRGRQAWQAAGGTASQHERQEPWNFRCYALLRAASLPFLVQHTCCLHKGHSLCVCQPTRLTHLACFPCCHGADPHQRHHDEALLQGQGSAGGWRRHRSRCAVQGNAALCFTCLQCSLSAALPCFTVLEEH